MTSSNMDRYHGRTAELRCGARQGFRLQPGLSAAKRWKDGEDLIAAPGFASPNPGYCEFHGLVGHYPNGRSALRRTIGKTSPPRNNPSVRTATAMVVMVS